MTAAAQTPPPPIRPRRRHPAVGVGAGRSQARARHRHAVGRRGHPGRRRQRRDARQCRADGQGGGRDQGGRHRRARHPDQRHQPQPAIPYVENQPPTITGYQASNTVNLNVRDIGKLGKILDALVASGANQINGPSFEIDEPEPAYDEARRAALEKAQARAEMYAKTLGMRVRRIVSISEGGGFRPPMPMPMMAMARWQGRGRHRGIAGRNHPVCQPRRGVRTRALSAAVPRPSNCHHRRRHSLDSPALRRNEN